MSAESSTNGIMAASNSLSYLFARDPSLLSTNVVQFKQIRVNLQNEMSPEEKVEHIKVFLRIKKGEMQLYEIENNTLICNIPKESQTAKNLKSDEIFAYTYSFSNIFGPDTTQAEIFSGIIKPNIIEFINGRNFNILTYGASGSGKTYTIIGTVMEPGILPRSLEYIFRTLNDLAPHPLCKPLANDEVIMLTSDLFKMEQENKLAILTSLNLEHDLHSKTYRKMQQRLSSEPVGILHRKSRVSLSIWVSFFEIYNEHIYDLLKPLPKNKIRPILKLGRSKNQNIYVKDLSSIYVKSGLEAYEILQYGLQNLNYAATAVNSHSSRSHSIFIIKLVQTPIPRGKTYINTLCFCDLAGLERMKNTKNVGVRLKESNNINKSLLVLSRCIQTIKSSQDSKKSQPVPFRDSKLTQLFQRGLSGEDNIALVVNLNPCRKMFDESLHSLNLSTFAKDIKIKKPVIEAFNNNRNCREYTHEGLAETDSDIYENTEGTEKLRDMVIHLCEEIEKLKADHAKDIVEQRLDVAQMYTDFAETKRIEYEKRQNNIIKAYQAEIENLKQQLDNSIVIIESDEENPADASFCVDLKKTEEIISLKQTVKDLEDQKRLTAQECAQYKADYLRVMEENRKLTLENAKLKQICEEKKGALNHARRMTIAYEQIAEEEWNKRKQLLLRQEEEAQLELDFNEDPEEPEEDMTDNE